MPAHRLKDEGPDSLQGDFDGAPLLAQDLQDHDVLALGLPLRQRRRHAGTRLQDAEVPGLLLFQLRLLQHMQESSNFFWQVLDQHP